MDYTVFPLEETEKERRGRIKDTVAWYLKWFSSIIIVCAMSMRATGEVQ